MPRVPLSTGPTVAEQPLPGVREHSMATPELLGGPGRELQQTGAAVTSLGTQVGAIQRQLLDQANAMRVDDALNQAQEIALRLQHGDSGFTKLTGYDALKRTSGLPLADEFTQKLQDHIGKIAGGLDNDQQRRLFGMKANDVVRSFYGHAATYEDQQQKTYNQSVLDGTVSSAKSALTLAPLDPKNVEMQTTRIRGAIMGGQREDGTFVPGSAQMQGKSVSWAKERADEAVSDAHGNAVKLMLEMGRVGEANAYFRKYSEQMVAKDVLEVQGRLTTMTDTATGMAAARAVWGKLGEAVTPDNDMARLTGLVMQQESGGNPNAVSPKGAKGLMQVMDATNRDPGFGVRPAKDDSPEERVRVGRDYLAAMVKRYNGNLPQALAAYNAGPGAVDAALAEAEKDVKTGAFRGDPGPNYFLSKLPKETQDYVTAIGAKYVGGFTPPKPTLEQLHGAVDALVGPNASPNTIKAAREEVTRRFEDAKKAETQRETEVVVAAQQELLANGGNFNELRPSTAAALRRYAPGKVDDLQTFAGKIRNGQDQTNPAAYLRLSDPNYLGTLSEQQLFALRPQLSEADYKHFVQERTKLVTGQASNGPGDLNTAAVKNVLDQRLRELKIDPTPKDDGGADAARVGTIRRIVDTQLLAMQREQGKKFNDAETAAAIDKLFATNVEVKGRFTNKSMSVFSVNPGGLFGSDIPSDTRDKIKGAFKRAGVSDPTDAQVYDAYVQKTLAERGRKK